jgi:hypothetical protein
MEKAMEDPAVLIPQTLFHACALQQIQIAV